MRSTPRRCPPPRRWRTSPSCWCSRSWGRPGARRDSRSRRRRQTFGGNSGRRTRRSARQYCKVVRPKVQQYAHLLLEWNRIINLTGARTLEEGAALLELALPFVRTGGDLVAQVSPLDPLVLEPAARLLGGGLPRLEHPAGGHALVVVPKLVPTPARFPRRSGLPGRKPLS